MENNQPLPAAARGPAPCENQTALSFRLGALATRVKFRLDAILERDGSRKKAVVGAGFGIGFLFAEDLESALTEASEVIPLLLEACEQAKKYLEPDLVEPGRTVFWNLVDAIAKAKSTSSQGGARDSQSAGN